MKTYIPGDPRGAAAPGPARRETPPPAPEPETVAGPERGGARKGLSPAEKRGLIGYARAAYARSGAAKAGIDFDEWRHDQVAIATGGKAGGFREMKRYQFREVKAHFLAGAGQTRQALRVQLGAGEDVFNKEEALGVLDQACKTIGVHYPGYPETICKTQNHGRGMDEVDAAAIWRLVYTVRNRRKVVRPKNGPRIDSERPEPGALS